MKTCAIVVAAGRSTRFGGELPKQYHSVNGRPLLAWTLSRFEESPEIDEITLVVSDDFLLHVAKYVIEPFGFDKVRRVVSGGETRRESVLKGLRALPKSTTYVAIHDGARPLVSLGDITGVVELARRERAAMLAVPVSDTIKHVTDGCVLATLDRSSLWLAQTPQVFEYRLIMEAHEKCAAGTLTAVTTDDAALVEACGVKVRVKEATSPNLKVTTASDLVVVAALLKEAQGDV